MPNSVAVSFAASIAELTHGEKLDTQSINYSLTHPGCLIPQKPKLLLWKRQFYQYNFTITRSKTVDFPFPIFTITASQHIILCIRLRMMFYLSLSQTVQAKLMTQLYTVYFSDLKLL